jgi:hypothetical protein
MSSREAREPSFITFVLESTLSGLVLPESVRVLLERSKFWTRPLSVSKCPLVPAEGLLEEELDPMLLLVPVLSEDVDPEPVPIEPALPE